MDIDSKGNKKEWKTTIVPIIENLLKDLPKNNLPIKYYRDVDDMPITVFQDFVSAGWKFKYISPTSNCCSYRGDYQNYYLIDRYE